MGNPHVLAIPYPAQGHVIPLMELAQCLVKHSFKVTFVNTEFNHKRVMNALSDKDSVGDQIHLVSIPDGLEPWEDRNDLGKLSEAIFQVMPGKLEELIEKINGSGSDNISCIIADETCSVIYVAFGSFTVFDQTQFQELALGLELANRPFLWVVRPDITDETIDAYPIGFKDRVATHGCMVGWAPQQKVLGHPSIACFLSHCGWNSTMEGVSNGIPFLCWPYFADQFLNQSYICDVWKVGLGFSRDERGIITQGEIKDKVEQLLSDQTFKERALDIKEKAMGDIKEGGHSHKNFNNFIEWMKA
ncbi:hypothetical protein F0562_004349 [Nyssa sinensis]|uniref:UDP-glycosyltransferases domain-containing protein n=1 Tax=Nyssa sinensis TaxID=561372 RepID=A0A5J5C171_9ASTE|nr:hypothetical protein F0562_004349 [Nyssa sinensis]